MATINHQRVCPIPSANLVITVLTLTAASDSVDLPWMKASSNAAVQLLRPSDSAITIAHDGTNPRNRLTLTGTSGQEVLIVSFHDDPLPNNVGGL